MKTEKPGNALVIALRGSRTAFVVVCVFSFFLNLLYLTSPLYMLQVYDRVLASGRHETLFYLTLIAVFALVIFGILEGLRQALLSRIGAWLHSGVADSVIVASVQSSLHNKPVGGQGLRDLQAVQSFVGSRMIVPFFDAPWAPFFIAVIWMLHPFLGMMALASAVVLFVVAILNDVITRKPLAEANTASSVAQRDAERALVNSETIQAMGMLPAILARWRGRSQEAQLAMSRAAERGGWMTGLSRFIRLVVQVGILGLGALLVLESQLSPGGMIAGSILLSRALAPVEQSIGAWRSFRGYTQSRKRLKALLEEHPAHEDAMPLPEIVGNLSVEGLTIRAPEGQQLILRNVTFALSAGDVLAIVGPSAAGKSTLCRAICGVIPPTAGHIRLDGAEISQYPREQFGRALGYLPQTVELFAGTVRENIARMGDGDPEAVVRAAQLANVHDMVLQLPDGYETRIGAGGVNLSGGQRQRLGLARALFGNPKLVVLDEPNSNLDQAGENALATAIRQLKLMGTTVILVAHRQSAIGSADKLMVLTGGQIEVFDDRDTVLRMLDERRRFSQSASSPDVQRSSS